MRERYATMVELLTTTPAPAHVQIPSMEIHANHVGRTSDKYKYQEVKELHIVPSDIHAW